MERNHHWKARFTVGTVMLVLAFLGIVFTNVKASSGWDYWVWVIPIYAVLALWLSWDVKRDRETMSPITVWHELLHWIGTIGAVFLVTLFVKQGVVSRYSAGFFDLTLLSLSLFLAGIYIEKFLLVIGITLALFGIVMAAFTEYLYAISLLVLVGGIAAVALSVWHSHRKSA